MTFKYIHNQNNSEKLFIYFNNMTQIGFSDRFTYYKTLMNTFNDYDLLFIKDIEIGYYYLTIIDDIDNLITKLVKEYNYKKIVSYGDSAGAMPILNILPKYDIFKKAIIINGQVSLKKEVIDIYRKLPITVKTYVFNEKKIKKIYNKIYKEPLNNLQDTNNYEITCYYNSVGSDAVYCELIKNLNYSNMKIINDKLNMNHIMYIIYKTSSAEFFTDMKQYFDN